MKNCEVHNSKTDEMVHAYRDAARKHAEASELGDYKSANKSAELIAAIYSELKHRGPSEQAQLLPLLVDSDLGVRLWVASHALEFSPAEGEAVLSSLASGGHLLGITAETTLKEWRAGRLRF